MNINKLIFCMLCSLMFWNFNFKKNTSEFYVVKTNKNCLSCFSKLNDKIHKKLGKNKSEINYILTDNNIVSKKLFISSISTNDSIKILSCENEKKLQFLKSNLSSDSISPYIIIVSKNKISVISHQKLFLSNGHINLEWL